MEKNIDIRKEVIYNISLKLNQEELENLIKDIDDIYYPYIVTEQITNFLKSNLIKN